MAKKKTIRELLITRERGNIGGVEEQWWIVSVELWSTDDHWIQAIKNTEPDQDLSLIKAMRVNLTLPITVNRPKKD